jgi:hypothetical protein
MQSHSGRSKAVEKSQYGANKTGGQERGCDRVHETGKQLEPFIESRIVHLSRIPSAFSRVWHAKIAR